MVLEKIFTVALCQSFFFFSAEVKRTEGPSFRTFLAPHPSDLVPPHNQTRQDKTTLGVDSDLHFVALDIPGQILPGDQQLTH